MRWILILTVLAVTLSPSYARSLSKLPGWARDALTAVDLDSPPEGASVWRILDETEISVLDGNRFRIKRRVVQYVVDLRGSFRASFYLIDGDEDSTQIKKLRGWHLNRFDKLDKLNKKNAVTLGRSTIDKLTRDTLTATAFDDVYSGSIVVFESDEIQKSYFPATTFSVMESFPIDRKIYRMEAGGDELSMLALGFEGWDLESRESEDGLTIRRVPGLEAEPQSPDSADAYPRVMVRALRFDASYRLESWDALAKWYTKLFDNRAHGDRAPGTKPLDDPTNIDAVVTWFRDQISYKQRYLSAERGWVPLSGPRVEELAYGDCKDMVACFAYKLEPLGFEVHPALANIVNGPYTTAADPPGPAFNHLIAAIPVTDAVTAPAVVTTNGKRYLLYDPTDKYTRPGYLSGGFRGREVMICTAEGAVWAEIPEAALEEERLSISLSGALDGNLTLNGTMVIGEKGNAMGLRILAAGENRRLTERVTKESLGIPGVVDLEELERKVSPAGETHLAYEITWPSFLRRDEDGFRLPTAIIGVSGTSLIGEGDLRQNPVAFSAMPEVHWKLTLVTGFPVKTGVAEASFTGDYHRFDWKARGGKRLFVDFVERGKRGFFSRAELGEATKHWNAYVREWSDFSAKGTLIHIGEETREDQAGEE